MALLASKVERSVVVMERVPSAFMSLLDAAREVIRVLQVLQPCGLCLLDVGRCSHAGGGDDDIQ